MALTGNVGYLETATLEAGLAEGDVTLLGEELGDKQEAVRVGPEGRRFSDGVLRQQTIEAAGALWETQDVSVGLTGTSCLCCGGGAPSPAPHAAALARAPAGASSPESATEI